MAHVLLIEPNIVLGNTYRQALEHAGHTVSYAQGAQDAVQAADARTPDVVVTELQLAAHDGIEFLHEFRSYPEWLEIPVIIHTSIAPQALEPLTGALAEDLGVRLCLYKPHTALAKLLSSVRQLVTA